MSFLGACLLLADIVLVTCLQLRAPAPLPPQPAHSDALSNLDRIELGRLLAANQALVQQQVWNVAGVTSSMDWFRAQT